MQVKTLVRSVPGRALFDACRRAGRGPGGHAGRRPRRPPSSRPSSALVELHGGGARALLDVHLRDVAVAQSNDRTGRRQTVTAAAATAVIRNTRLHDPTPTHVSAQLSMQARRQGGVRWVTPNISKI